MDDIQNLLTANLVEALRQVQNYLVLAAGAALSAFALAFRPAKAQEAEVPVPILSIPVTRSAAHLVFWGVTLIGGFMAGFSAERAYVIAIKLKSVPGLLEAVSTFPTFATSYMLAARFLPILVPPILSGVAVWLQLQREKAPITAKGFMVFLTLAVYLPLWLQLGQVVRLLGTR